MNRLLEKLAIDLPIIQAPMAGISTPEMAAAVSNAGALGSIGVGAVDAPKARDMILAIRALTKRSFNVNVFCHQPPSRNVERELAWLAHLAPDFKQFKAQPPAHLRAVYKSFLEDDEMLAVLLELRPKVVSFHFGLPPQEAIRRMQQAGIVLLAGATNLEEAAQVVEAGIDAVVVQGYEAGGHRGMFDPAGDDGRLELAALVPLIAGEFKIPVIAAGGIMDGAGIVAALGLGAQAVQLGTAFIGCPESSADNYFRTALKSDAAHHTVMTRAISGRPARCLANRFTKIGEGIDPHMVPDYPIAYDAGKTLNAVAKRSGEGGYGAQWAGTGAPQARFLPAAELVAKLRDEMMQTTTGAN